MSSYDEVIKKKGYPVLEERDELQKFMQQLSSGPSKAALASSGSTDTPPSSTAMGDDDVKNIFYVNFDPNTNMLTQAQRDELKKIQSDIDLNCNFLSLKAGETVQSKINSGDLSDKMDIEAMVKRSTYRAKVTDALIQQSSWMGNYAQQSFDRTFQVDKSEFHAELLTAMFDGLSMPGTVFKKVEGLLNEIANSVTQTSKSGTKKMFWILMTIYTWESVMQVFRPSVRTVYFEATDSVTTYTDNKNDVTKVDMFLGWLQQDCNFNQSSFPRDTILKFLQDSGVDIVNDPIEIPVD